ncbi:MAG: hypothetical protein ACFFD1_12730, partial [Candidatus Thorarchaeota archaeon]
VANKKNTKFLNDWEKKWSSRPISSNFDIKTIYLLKFAKQIKYLYYFDVKAEEKLVMIDKVFEALEKGLKEVKNCLETLYYIYETP